jgi:signal transduction histidine kinase
MRWKGDYYCDPGTGYGRTLWPVLVLLVVAVLVPTGCVLWFMSEAVKNERLAVRQRLEDAYRSRLRDACGALETWWQERAEVLGPTDGGLLADETFARLVAAGVADSVVLFDHQGSARYPGAESVVPVDPETRSPLWQQAEAREHIDGDSAQAAELYARIADQSEDSATVARALQAQARCLAASGKHDAALDILLNGLGEPRFRDARDPQGRLIVPSAQLFALTLMNKSADADRQRVAVSLRARLADYGEPVMPASQRRFLMAEWQRMQPDELAFATLEAENLAAEFLERGGRRSVPGVLVRSPLRGVWQWTASDEAVVALFHEDRLMAALDERATAGMSLGDARIHVRPATWKMPGVEPLLTEPAGDVLADWRLAVYLTGPDPFSAAAERRIAFYLWTAIWVVVLVAGLALLLARYLGRQVRLTRLKNDLIATVSHELKTPLTSIRVLTDTLLAGRPADETKTREYLGLIARENLRLSRLIDSFLTFSRMERNKRRFEMRQVKPADVTAEAVEAVRERYDSAGFNLEVETQADLPVVTGDRDALVTVVINLLDNAWKYSQNDKRVIVRTSAEEGEVRFEVTDHGVGLSRRERVRIFEKFYQADKSLSRQSSGCGLGLSIVKFIVDAHNGTIDVVSNPGQGSTFTVRLPVAGQCEE